MADPKGRSAMEVGEYLREYERFAGLTEQAVCWPDPDTAYDDARQEEVDNEREGK